MDIHIGLEFFCFILFLSCSFFDGGGVTTVCRIYLEGPGSKWDWNHYVKIPNN